MATESNNNESLRRLGPLVDDSTVAEEINGQDLAIVLSRYSIGSIDSILDYRKGSRRAAKMVVHSQNGKYLLKRRAFGQDDRFQVEFAHGVQKRLQEHRFPVAGLVETIDGETLVHHDGRIYELFSFIHGKRFDKSNPAAAESGRVLAHFHDILKDYPEEPTVKTISFHKKAKVLNVMSELQDVLERNEAPARLEGLRDTIAYLLCQYKDAHTKVELSGFSTFPSSIVHGDWHPGNILYKDGEIIAVIDFDSLRKSPRITDIANGVLQFSIRMGDAEDVEDWAETFRGHTIRSIVQSYSQFTTVPLSEAERSIIPPLMVEALIVESIIPIHKTGSFGRICGSSFLRMVEKKLRWLEPRAGRVIEVIQPPNSEKDGLE